MKRCLIVAISAFMLLALGTVAHSQPENGAGDTRASETKSEEPVIFPWAARPGGAAANWPDGVVRALLGIAGALVTVYLFLGDFLPSMGGKAEYEALKLELDDLKERRDRTWAERERAALGEVDAAVTARLGAQDSLSADFEHAIDQLEAQISRERRRLFALALPLYVVLGGFFSAAFATNLLQAILVGFGWTAIADRIGLKREEAVRREKRGEEIDKVVEVSETYKEQAESAHKELAVVRAERDALSQFSAALQATLATTSTASTGTTSGQG